MYVALLAASRGVEESQTSIRVADVLGRHAEARPLLVRGQQKQDAAPPRLDHPGVDHRL